MRDSWGTKNYKSDMDFSKCKQVEPTDKFGTPKEIANACYHEWEMLEKNLSLFSNAITMLTKIQQGIPEEKATLIKKPKVFSFKIAPPQQIANAVHHNLDWLRACQKRTWDGRGINPKKQMLEASLKGLWINHATPLHYDESPERY